MAPKRLESIIGREAMEQQESQQDQEAEGSQLQTQAQIRESERDMTGSNKLTMPTCKDILPPARPHLFKPPPALGGCERFLQVLPQVGKWTAER